MAPRGVATAAAGSGGSRKVPIGDGKPSPTPSAERNISCSVVLPLLLSSGRVWLAVVPVPSDAAAQNIGRD